MTASLQMPLERGEAKRVSGRLFRKQVLRIGEIEHKDKRLRFDRPYLASLAESFNGHAFDQVPLVLVNEKNEHVSDPEKFRGEVKGFELTDDGLDALVELTDDGEQLVAKNPRLGVSARIVEDLKKSDGRRFPRAIEHVAATLNPVVNGLRGWESVSVLSASHTPEEEVIDLSTATYMDTQTLTDEQLTELQALKPEDRVAKLRELVPAEPAEKPEATDEGKGILARLKKMLDGHDAELEKSFDDLKDDAEADKDKEDDKQTVASLSDDDKRRIDLAESTAREADRRVAAAEWKSERRDYEEAGVPPALLDLAEPVLKSGVKATIDLSDSDKTEATDVIRKMLDEAKGTIDLSTVGSDKDSDETSEAKELASDKNWDASI